MLYNIFLQPPSRDDTPLAEELCSQPFPLISITPGKPSAAHQFASQHMAVYHNMLIRVLNSIYLQAAMVERCATHRDQMSFCWYIQLWCELMSHHHYHEEKILFPTLQERGRSQTIMSDAVDEHEKFKPGVDSLNRYATNCLSETHPDTYSGSTVLGIINGFGNELITHLHQEIDDLYNLHLQMSGHNIRHSMESMVGLASSRLTMATHFPVIMGAGRTGPGGEPYGLPVPYLIKLIVVHGLWNQHADSWKFLPCTIEGEPKTTLPYYPYPQSRRRHRRRMRPPLRPRPRRRFRRYVQVVS